MGHRNMPALGKLVSSIPASLLVHGIASKLACLEGGLVLLFALQSLLMHLIALAGLPEVMSALPLRSTLPVFILL